MREILFRGKLLHKDIWCYGNLSVKPQGVLITPDDSVCGVYGCVDPDSVQQYIGITDKTGVKIFEGDIVKTKYGRLCVITWHEKLLCWDMEPVLTRENLDKPAPQNWDMWYSDNLEIVGNIFNNSELLERNDSIEY